MRLPLTLLSAGCAVAIALAGCSSDDDGPVGDSTAEATASTAAATASTAAATAGGVTISMGEYFYRPERATARVGERVTFVNDGRIVHTVADTGPGGTIRSAVITPRPLAEGDRQVVVFSKAGLVRYLCTFHPTLMSGEIMITAD